MKFTTKQIINEHGVDTRPGGYAGELELSGTISGFRWSPVYSRRQTENQHSGHCEINAPRGREMEWAYKQPLSWKVRSKGRLVHFTYLFKTLKGLLIAYQKTNSRKNFEYVSPVGFIYFAEPSDIVLAAWGSF